MHEAISMYASKEVGPQPRAHHPTVAQRPHIAECLKSVPLSLSRWSFFLSFFLNFLLFQKKLITRDILLLDFVEP